MLSLASFTLAVTAVSSVSALVMPRATPPAGWATAYLEAQQNAATALAAQCLSATASPSAPAVTPTPTTSDGNDDDWCYEGDDGCICDDDNESSTSVVPTPTAPASTKTPATTPAATSTKAPSQTTTPAKTTTSSKTSTSSTAPAKTSTTRAEPTTPASSSNTGGFATYFFQNGVAGACGTVHSDNDFIAAMDKDRYGDLSAKSSLCGKRVKITNPANGKSVTVTVADACPTCKNSNSIDLSEGAFKQIATTEQGMVGTLQRILVVGGNGFIGSAICKAALSKGFQVTSVSSSGLPYRSAKGHAPAWVSQIDWQKGDALHPESFAHLFPEVDGIVHTLGTLLEDSSYKQAIKQGNVLGLLGILHNNIVGDHGNPLENSTSDAFVASSTDASIRTAPRPFIYISAEDIFRPIIPARYIETKREAEQGIDALLDGKPQYRGVHIRPSLVYHAHHRPLSTPPAVLLDLSASLHAKIPSTFPTPSSILRRVGATLSPHSPKTTSSLDSIANALTIPPIHVDHVAAAVCAALDSDNPVRGIVGVQRMRELVGWVSPSVEKEEGRVDHYRV
ncbi:hypothetical protein DXG01_017163 [Tephrocybe rancida]|nr:hypothetical protein DXG01_017163 [Tephrocybe rancida]